MPLIVEDLSVAVDSKRILDDISLRVDSGELLVIMGPNGSGKTSLALTIMGHPSYRVLKGRIIIDGEDVTDKPPDYRALKGLFLLFQNPVEIPGVNLKSLLRAALNKRMGKTDLTEPVPGLEEKLVAEAKMLGLSEEHLERDINVGFSGGEKKRSELLQAKILRPRYVIMDEPDSGLDVDGVRMVADIIRELISTGNAVVLITHYPRVLEYVEPSRVVVIHKGRIVATGGRELVDKINVEGYKWLGEAENGGSS